MRNYPAITLGALCGWVIGFSLAPYLGRIFPQEYFPVLLCIVHPLCVLGGAAVISLALPLPQRPNADPMEDEKHPLPNTSTRQLLALFYPSCGMTWFQRSLHAIGWACLLSCVLLGGASFFQTLMERFWETPPQQQPIVTALAEYADVPVALALFALATCILAPLSEEMLYRNLIPETLTGLYLPELLAVTISALLFAFAHGLIWAAPGFFCFALIQSHVAKKTDLLQCIIIHGLFNAINLLMVLFTVSCIPNAK